MFSTLSPFCKEIRSGMNFNQSETRASCHPHHPLLAFSNKSALIIARSVYIGWKSAGQGPLLLLFFLVKCAYVEPVPHRRCAGSATHSASQNLLPRACEASCSWAGEQEVRGHNQGKCVCASLSCFHCSHTYLSISFIWARAKHYSLCKDAVWTKCNHTVTCADACQGLN